MRSKVVVMSACCVTLSGCVGASGGGAGLAYHYSTQCMFEVDAPGAYVFNDGDDQVTAGGGATAEGAAALNACIQRKAAADGRTTLPDVAGVPQSLTTTADGRRTTETYTYGTPPAPKAPAKAARTATSGADVSFAGVPNCSLKMVGGTGYACAAD